MATSPDKRASGSGFQPSPKSSARTSDTRNPMEATKTVVCKLETTEEEFRIMDTVKAFRDACNYISEVAWEKRCFNPVALHHLVYYETRERFNLPANLAIRARDGVAKSYKVKRKKQHRFKKLSMDLDKRLFTLLRNGEFRASISTIEGGVKPKLAIGDYQRELLKKLEMPNSFTGVIVRSFICTSLFSSKLQNQKEITQLDLI